MSNTMLRLNHVSVKFKEKTALDLQTPIMVEEGDVVGIIGENGAGKSTLINAIMNRVPYEGEISRGFERKDIGIQFQNNAINPLMKVKELITLVTGKRKLEKNLAEEIERFCLTELLNTRIGNLSGGEKQRLVLFLVLYKDPKIMFFDELTTGLDYQKRVDLLNIVREKSDGKTVMVVSHYFEEFNNWVNKLLVLKEGQALFYGTLKELKELYPHKAVITIKKACYNDINLHALGIKESDIIRNFNEESVGIVVRNDYKRQETVTSYLGSKSISYDITPCNIYSLYALLQQEMERGVA